MNSNIYNFSNTVWGFSSADKMKPLVYPGVLQNVYSIFDNGDIYSSLSDCYISCAYRNGIPYVNLLNEDHVLCPHNIKDLVACSFIENSKDYLERGYKVVNIDGDQKNYKVENLMYIDPNKKY